MTPLMIAAGKGLVEAIQALVGKGADVNLVAGSGFTALFAAIDKRMRGTALYLIKEAPRVDVNVCGSYGKTLLMQASAEGMVDAMKALVAKGADVNAGNKFRATALQAAIAKKQEAAALFLMEEAGVIVHDPDYPRPVLSLAAAFRYSRLVPVSTEPTD